MPGRLGARASPPGWRSTAATRSRSTTTRATPRRPARSTTSRRTTRRRRRSSRGGRGSTTSSASSASSTRSSATGTCIKSFLNSPDQQSSRAGDPSTNARQFARGYIGLQNHGGGDVIDFRNVRVLPLDEGAVRGPVTVEGDGEHTVEYRSTDVAGNEEDVKSVTFTIGARPTTDAAGDDPRARPGAPGAGGTSTAGRRCRPPTRTSRAAASAGDARRQRPAQQLEPEHARRRDRRRRPLELPEATAGAPHDVWVIEPGEAPDSAGTRVSDEVVCPARRRCRRRSTRPAPGPTCARSTRMSSTAAGRAWSAPPRSRRPAVRRGSGVDFTEYRVNTAADVGPRPTNTGDDDPFETSFTVSARVSHVVDYRSTDNAGNQERSSRSRSRSPRPSTGGPPSGPPPGGSPPSGGGTEEGGSAVRVRAPKSARVQRVIRRGLRLRVSCEDACRARSVLRLAGERVGASKRLRISAGDSRTLVIRLKPAVRRNLVKAMRQARMRRVTVTAITTIATADMTRAFPVRVTLRR